MYVHPVSVGNSGGRICFLFACECVQGLGLRVGRARVEGVVGSFWAERRLGGGRGLLLLCL